MRAGFSHEIEESSFFSLFTDLVDGGTVEGAGGGDLGVVVAEGGGLAAGGDLSGEERGTERTEGERRAGSCFRSLSWCGPRPDSRARLCPPVNPIGVRDG